MVALLAFDGETGQVQEPMTEIDDVLATLAGARMGWRVEVVDDRPGLLIAERFPGASRLVRSEPGIAASTVSTDDTTSVMIMSHNLQRDAGYLRSFLSLPLRYLGVLGPRGRLMRMADEARRSGSVIQRGALDRVHGPAGLDLGAEGPQEIAFAIVGELLAVQNSDQGGFLRDRAGPVHGPSRREVRPGRSVDAARSGRLKPP